MNASASVADAPRFVERRRAPRAIGGWLVTAGIVTLLAWAVGARLWRLDQLPGINGDEAWSGVQAVRLVHGQPIAWRTPTGNPVNIWYLFPLAALHLLFEPSFGLLRVVAVISGLAAIAANYWLCRRVFDRRTAIVSTLIVALLPINVAYSRFGWDTSQTVLACLFVLYLPLARLNDIERAKRVSLAGVVALGLAIWVHPTNVFAAPLVVMPWAWANRERCRRWLQVTQFSARPAALILLAVMSAAVAYAGFRALAGVDLAARGPAELGAFLRDYVRLFSGSTAYTFLSGIDQAAGPDRWYAWLGPVSDWLFVGAAVLAALGWKRRLAEAVNAADLALLAGWSVMLLGFFVVAGPWAIAPHFERYALCLVAPGCLVLARGLSAWLDVAAEPARRILLALLLIAAWPVIFSLAYFVYLQQTGGTSHRAFRTAEREPKQQAFDYVMSQRAAGEPTLIVADDWWTYWPLAYLASTTPGLDVVSPGVTDAAAHAAPPKARRWRIEFVDPAGADSMADRHQEGLPRGAANREKHWVFASDGRPLLRITTPQH